MIEQFFSISALLNFAALLYFLGFVVRDELLLRLLVLCGTGLYIIYYFALPTGPLWDAIITSAFLGLANLWVLGKIVFERTTLALSDDEKILFECLEKLSPGQFRQIMKHAKWITVTKNTELFTQGEKANSLFYLLRGSVTLEKDDKIFTVGEKNFIGELSFILDGNYSASARLKNGACFVEWDNDSLRKLMKKNDTLSNAITAMFNTDMALKLSSSYQ